MSGEMRITKQWVRVEMHKLSKETGMGIYLEEFSYQRKNSFTLYQTDENGVVIKTLIPDHYTTREMYLALKAAREIYRAAINLHLQSSEQKEARARAQKLEAVTEWFIENGAFHCDVHDLTGLRKILEAQR